MAAPSILVVPEETSEPKTLVADRILERDRTEVSGPEPEPEPVIAEPEESKGGVPPMLWAAAAALLLAIGGGVWWNSTQTDAETSSEATQVAANEAEAPPPPVEEEPPANEPPPAAPAAEAPAHLPRMLADLRRLGYIERHARLANAPGKVSVELHVGLDLVQADESESPCRTFSDALTIMEGSERPRAFLWAIREAEAPTGKTSACKKLGPRLQTLRESVEPVVESPKPTRNSKKGRGRGRRHSTPTTPTAQPETPATPVAPPEPPPSDKAKDKDKDKGVATKLDDDLRGL